MPEIKGTAEIVKTVIAECQNGRRFTIHLMRIQAGSNRAGGTYSYSYEIIAQPAGERVSAKHRLSMDLEELLDQALTEIEDLP